MNRSGMRFGLVLVLSGLLAGVAWAEETVTVTVQGEGISEEAALKDALRKALEEGGRVEISSHSQVENFQLIRDTIYSRAEGIVTDYKVLDKKPGMGGVFICKIEARVSKSAVATTWGEVQNVLDQVGRPGVMVFIAEFIDGVRDDSSILEAKIEERLVKSGFDVYAGQHVQEVLKKEGADAAAENNIAKLQAVAKNFGAQIFVAGSAHANQAGITETAGTKLAMYNGDAVVKMYYTDTGKLITTESLANWRGGARGEYSFSPQAGKMALANAGMELVERTYVACMQNWATRISAGDMIELQIEGLPAGEAIKLKKRLAELPNVQNVNYAMSKEIATYRIKAKMDAQGLAEHLVEGEWDKLIEIVDVQMNRIQAKAKARTEAPKP